MGTAREQLDRLIGARLAPKADRRRIDAEIHRRFRKKRCIVFTDLAGFSYHSAREGIIPLLAQIHELERICLPFAEKFGGAVIKRIADSWMLAFPTARAGLNALTGMQRALDAMNSGRPADQRVYLCAGLGWGEMLVVGDEDLFGVEVNYAAKLGEDIARPYEILLTPDAVAELRGTAGVKFVKVSGSRLVGSRRSYYRADYGPLLSAPPKPARPAPRKPLRKSRPAGPKVR